MGAEDEGVLIFELGKGDLGCLAWRDCFTCPLYECAEYEAGENTPVNPALIDSIILRGADLGHLPVEALKRYAGSQAYYVPDNIIEAAKEELGEPVGEPAEYIERGVKEGFHFRVVAAVLGYTSRTRAVTFARKIGFDIASHTKEHRRLYGFMGSRT